MSFIEIFNIDTYKTNRRKFIASPCQFTSYSGITSVWPM